MHMVMMLDTMANRYHMLPSQVLGTATTLDLNIFERAMAYRDRQNDPNHDPSKPVAPKLSQEEMRAMIEAVNKKANV